MGSARVDATHYRFLVSIERVLCIKKMEFKFACSMSLKRLLFDLGEPL